MAKDVPLDIKYLECGAKTNTEVFFAQIGGRIAQSRSLDVGTRRWDPVLAALKQANTPNLKTLKLRGPPGHDWKDSVVTFFGGEPASATLKDLRVEDIPVAIAPLRLSRLRSLRLQTMPIISVQEVLRILRESPALNLLHLTGLVFALPSPTHGPDHPAIQLSRLHSLTLRGLPVSITHLILSVIRAPKLQRVYVECNIDEHGQSPTSELFTTKISHLTPSLKTLAKKAQRIEMVPFDGNHWTISIGWLTIGLGGRLPQLNHLRGLLDWIFSNLGQHVRTLPVSLNVLDFGVDTEWFIWLASHLKVTELNFQVGLFPVHGVNSQREIVSLLSQPLESANNQWLMLALESIEISVVSEGDKSKFLEMVKARHSYIEEQGEQRTEGTVLKPFQEIRLGGGRDHFNKELGPDPEFLAAVQKVGRGAEIWWKGVKWTGIEGASCVGEIEGNV